MSLYTFKFPCVKCNLPMSKNLFSNKYKCKKCGFILILG